MAKLISKLAFSKLAGVSDARITQISKPGEPLAKAMVGKFIDAHHIEAVRYLEGQGVSPFEVNKLLNKKPRGTAKKVPPTRPLPPPRYQPPPEPKPPPPMETFEATKYGPKPKRKNRKQDEDYYEIGEVPEHIREFGNMTLLEIIDKFGTDERFANWLKASKSIEDIHGARVKVAEKEGELIPRKLVETHVFAAMSDLHKRILKDAPKTIVARATEAHDSGEAKEQIEVIVRDIISNQIRAMKQKVTGALRSV